MNKPDLNQTPILIADIGGTNARFALSTQQAPFFNSAKTLQCADFDKFEEAVDAYLRTHKIKKLGGICFAVAGPIDDGRVEFTNNHWKIDSAKLSSEHQLDKIKLLNDFEAIAYSLARLTSIKDSDSFESINGNWVFDTKQDFTVGIVGPGSGLGVAGLNQKNGELFANVTEGGHAGFSPENIQQLEILRYLHQKYDDRVSCERLISGPGMVNIHEALCQIVGQENPSLSAADIANAAVNGNDSLCQQTFELFFEILGQVAGDLALTIGAFDGIFIAGGIAQRYPEQLNNSNFRTGFENKGRHRHLMEATPTWLISHKNPGLLGASVYAQEYL